MIKILQASNSKFEENFTKQDVHIHKSYPIGVKIEEKKIFLETKAEIRSFIFAKKLISSLMFV